MPEALRENLTPKDAADVIAWLRETGGGKKTAPDRVVLFDEEEDFIGKLRDGNGKATFETTGAFSGKAALGMTVFQRHSQRIPGWNYRITEKPMPGEFRYLRLAWKATDAECVMVELAADAKWPAPESSRGRYYAGRNASKWEARQVSPHVPGEWRVITLDLWKDMGEFTLTGIAPTTFGGKAFFDKIELLRDLQSAATAKAAQ
jgi:hypothetical protein